MKTYRGNREPLCHVRVLDDAGPGSPFAPPPLPGTNGSHLGGGQELAVPRELIAQALVPFDWGQDGPGTHYLAVALLADLLGAADRAGIKSALPFLRRFLSRLPKDDFEISETVFRAFVYAVALPAAAAQRALPGRPAAPDAPNGAASPDAPRPSPRTHADHSESPEHTPRRDDRPA